VTIFLAVSDRPVLDIYLPETLVSESGPKSSRLLASRPSGEPSEENFKLLEVRNVERRRCRIRTKGGRRAARHRGQLRFVFSEYPRDQSFGPFSVAAVILAQVLKQRLFLDGYTKAVGSQRRHNDG
jgi:hypothetical protein